MMERLDEAVDHVRGGPEGGSSSSTATTSARTRARRSGRSSASRPSSASGCGSAFRHFPLTEIHPHALAAATAAEAAALQGRFWEMHEVLFRRQKALEDEDLRALRRGSRARLWSVRGRPCRRRRCSRGSAADVESGLATGEVLGTPTLFIDRGPVHRGPYDAAVLLQEVTVP
jgi:hypothetical protein